MVHVHTLALGSYQTNCYLVWGDDSKTCVVIDPGYSPKQILDTAATLGKTVEAIFLTHGHFDHVGAVEAIVEATDCALWMREGDWSQFPSPFVMQLFPLANCDFCDVNFYEHGETLSLAGLTFTVLETPGHSWGSVCIRTEDVLFSGDTLFAGSIGRTDFPGSSPEAMEESLAQLKAIPEDLAVFPGHGESTTLSREKKYNPYLR